MCRPEDRRAQDDRERNSGSHGERSLYFALKQRVALEVVEARRQLVQAQQSLKVVRDQVLPPLRRAVALAEDQYQKGDVASLFVVEQNRGLVDVQFRIVDSEAAIRRAQAQLERSVGSRY